jgi:hypothetical protein
MSARATIIPINQTDDMEWDLREVLIEPEYSCDRINECQAVLQSLKVKKEDEDYMMELLEIVRESNVELRAYARTGWIKAEESTQIYEGGEGCLFDDIESELEEEGLFVITA